MNTFNAVLKDTITPNPAKLSAEALVSLTTALKDAWEQLPVAVQHRFCACPASTTHHQNYAGGLLEHSILLAQYLYSRTAEAGTKCAVALSAAQCARIALFHDLCKVGRYIRTENGYEYNPEADNRHAILSLERVNAYGIKLSRTEKVAILLHMAGGWYEKADEAALTLVDRIWLAVNHRTISAVQWADMKAC